MKRPKPNPGRELAGAKRGRNTRREILRTMGQGDLETVTGVPTVVSIAGAAVTAAGAAVATAADAAAQRTALGLGTAAVEDADAFAAAAGTLIIENRTSDPGSPETGRIWLRTDL